MRSPFLPPPSLEELKSRPLHELVRDFPELLDVLVFPEGREGERGWATLSDPQTPEGVLEEAMETLAWRSTPHQDREGWVGGP